MRNNFTKEDIKNSVEYRWRKNAFCWMLAIWGIAMLVMVFVLLLMGINEMEYIILILDSGLKVPFLFSIFFLPILLFYGYKMHYLLKNYEGFSSHEVILNNVFLSYRYRGAAYYRVIIEVEGEIMEVCTSPCFSNSVFTELTLENYNNKRVVGLYDSRMNRFYIIKKIG
jgi:hypothetical protein